MTVAGLQASYDQAIDLSSTSRSAPHPDGLVVLRPGDVAERPDEDGREGRAFRPDRDRRHLPVGTSGFHVEMSKGAGDRALRSRGRGRPRPLRSQGIRPRCRRRPCEARDVPALAALVGASFVIRTVLAWLRSAPALFPDEYIYASIGRSIADSGRPLIRGGSRHFPALLQPIVTAPAWLVGDVGLAFRLVQAIGALSMSLAAVPVFLLARRLGLSSRVSLALAAFAVLVPDLLYASFISSEALAYPLLLASVYAATRALAQPTRRAQIAFVVLAVLTTLARVQFAALPIVFVLAAFVVGVRERRLKEALREQLLAIGVFAVAAAALLASGPPRTVGVYRWLLGFHAGPLGIVHWAALDAMTLAYAAGWIIVPGALLGLWLTLVAPALHRRARLRRRRRAPRRRAVLRGRPAPGEPDVRQGDPGALRLLRRAAARSRASPSTPRGAGLFGFPTSRSPPRSYWSRCDYRSAAMRSPRPSTARRSCSASTG